MTTPRFRAPVMAIKFEYLSEETPLHERERADSRKLRIHPASLISDLSRVLANEKDLGTRTMNTITF